MSISNSQFLTGFFSLEMHLVIQVNICSVFIVANLRLNIIWARNVIPPSTCGLNPGYPGRVKIKVHCFCHRSVLSTAGLMALLPVTDSVKFAMTLLCVSVFFLVFFRLFFRRLSLAVVRCFHVISAPKHPS